MKFNRAKRAATARPERVWDYAVIPYEIDANFSGVHKALFKQVKIYFFYSNVFYFDLKYNFDIFKLQCYRNHTLNSML